MNIHKLIFQDLRSEDFFSSLTRKQNNPYLIFFYDDISVEKYAKLRKNFSEAELKQLINKYFEPRSVNTSSEDGMLIWNFLNKRRFHESLTNSILIFDINTGIKSSKYGVLKKDEIFGYLSKTIATISKFNLGNNISGTSIFSSNKSDMISSINH